MSRLIVYDIIGFGLHT